MEILWTSPKLSPWTPTALTLYIFNVKMWKMPCSGTKKTELLCFTFVLLSHINCVSLTFSFSVGLHCRVSFFFHCDVWLDCGCVSLNKQTNKKASILLNVSLCYKAWWSKSGSLHSLCLYCTPACTVISSNPQCRLHGQPDIVCFAWLPQVLAWETDAPWERQHGQTGDLCG